MSTDLSTDPETDFREGRRLFEDRRFMESLALFARVVQAAPDHAEGHYGHGLALFSLGRLDEAEASFRATLEHNPRYADAWFQLGAIAEHRGGRQAAIEAYKEAVAINPSHGARNRLQVLSPPASNVSQGAASNGRESSPVSRKDLAFWPAEIGNVSRLIPHSEPDPDLPLLPAFERPTVHTFLFELVRDGQPSLSVEMRGAKLSGLPPQNGDRIAIPAQQNEHGRYQIDSFQRLSDPQEHVVMHRRVDNAAVRRTAWLAKMRTYRPFAMVTAKVVSLIVLLLVGLLVVLPEARQTMRDEQARQQRWEKQMEAEERRFDREQSKAERRAEREMKEQEQAIEQAAQESELEQGAVQQQAEEDLRGLEQEAAEDQRRFERETRQIQQRFQQKHEEDCLEAGFDESACNRYSP